MECAEGVSRGQEWKIPNTGSSERAAGLVTTEESLGRTHGMNRQTDLPFCIHRVDGRTIDFAQLYEQLSHKLLLATLVILRLTRLNAKYCGPLKKRKKESCRKTASTLQFTPGNMLAMLLG